MSNSLQTIPSFTINKKEFFTLWVKHYLHTLNTKILKQALLRNREALQANHFKTKIEVGFEKVKVDDRELQFLIYNKITSTQKLQHDFE